MNVYAVMHGYDYENSEINRNKLVGIFSTFDNAVKFCTDGIKNNTLYFAPSYINVTPLINKNEERVEWNARGQYMEINKWELDKNYYV